MSQPLTYTREALQAPDPARPGWLHLLIDAAQDWVAVRASTMGAALAYYTTFSLAPLLLIVVSLAGLVLGDQAVAGELAAQLKGLLGDEAAQWVQGLLQSVNKPATGLVSSFVGAGLMVFGATTVLGELQASLNTIWRVPASEQGKGVWGYLRTRVLSLGVIVATGFLLIVSLVLSTATTVLEQGWLPQLGSWGEKRWLLAGIDQAVGVVPTALMFAIIYRLLPRVRLTWGDVWVAALLTAVLFAIGRHLIGLYIGRSGIASGFGASASLVVLLVWVFYSAQIFLYGASFCRMYALSRGSLKTSASCQLKR